MVVLFYCVFLRKGPNLGHISIKTKYVLSARFFFSLLLVYAVDSTKLFSKPLILIFQVGTVVSHLPFRFLLGQPFFANHQLKYAFWQGSIQNTDLGIFTKRIGLTSQT